MRARGAAAFILTMTIAAMTIAAPASAQLRPLLPFTAGDTLTPPDARDAAALQPLRLDLMSGAVPHSFNTPGCEPAGRATGLSPLPNQPIAANGFRFGSNVRLTLFGFSRDGCAFDALGGGGFAFSVPIRKDVMFMWGGGALYLPHGGPNGAPVKDFAAQASIVWRGKNGRSYAVGLGTKLGGPHVSFAGTF